MEAQAAQESVSQPLKIKRTKTVCDELQCSPVTLWRLVRDGKYPKPLKLNGQNVWPIDTQPIFDD